MPHWTMHGQTNIGRVRGNNEDSFALLPEVGLAVLADGMGGHAAGEVASRLAVDTVTHQLPIHLGALPAPQALAQAIVDANGVVFTTAAQDAACAGMGTTVVAALFAAETVYIAHVGDSRAYRLRAGRLERLTQDHTLAQEWLDLGSLSPEAARVSPYRNVLTSAVGTEAAVQPAVRTETASPGDLYLLCSDGLTDMLADARIEGLLMAQRPHLALIAGHLISAANAAGGMDNITVVLAQTN
jgi:protein phosphatase